MRGGNMAAYYFFAFMASVSLTNYLNVYLETELGFTGSQLGLVTGFMPLAAAVMMPFMGAFADKHGVHKPLLMLSLALSALSAYFLGLQSAVFMVIICCAVIELFKSVAMSMGDTITMEHCLNNGKNYGFIRSFGSAGWLIGGTVLGLLASRVTLSTLMFPMTIAGFAIAFCAATLFKFRRPVDYQPAKQNTAAIIKQLLSNRQYMFMLFATLFCFYTFDTALGYMGNHLITTLGGDTRAISLNTVCCVLPEIFFLGVVSGFILPKKGFRWLFRVTTVTVIIRCIYSIVVKDPYLFTIGSLLHCFTVGCVPVASLAYIRRVLPPNIYGTGVTIISMAMTFSRALFGWFYGNLYELFGSTSIFVFLLIINVVSSVIIFRTHHFDEENIPPAQV